MSVSKLHKEKEREQRKEKRKKKDVISKSVTESKPVEPVSKSMKHDSKSKLDSRSSSKIQKSAEKVSNVSPIKKPSGLHENTSKLTDTGSASKPSPLKPQINLKPVTLSSLKEKPAPTPSKKTGGREGVRGGGAVHSDTMSGKKDKKQKHSSFYQQEKDSLTPPPVKKQKVSPTPSGAKVTESKTKMKPQPTRQKTAPASKPVPVVMDWFSAQLESQVQQKKETRKKPVGMGGASGGGAAPRGNSKPLPVTSSSSKDAVLAAKFPHKRKWLGNDKQVSKSNSSSKTKRFT